MKQPSLFSRRDFFQTGLGLAVGLSVPTFIPGSVLGKDGAVAPSNRITFAGIGINHRGSYVLNYMLPQPDVRFLAIADVRADRRQAVKARIDKLYDNTDCGMYRDFRELLERKDIDAVFIATGDRWHTTASVYAAKAGKDVYSEKPCCITIGQCKILADVMRRYNRVFQAGTQRRSVDNFRFAVDLARSGKLGKIHTVHASIYHLNLRRDWLPAQPVPDKEIVDWDLWLGPAPWRPYNEAYILGDWRAQEDFDSGAKLHDWGAHTVDLCQWAVNGDTTIPVEYEADGGTVYAKYADGVKLVMRPDGWMGLGDCPVRFEGDEGWVETGDTGRVALYPESLRSELRSSGNFGGIAPEAHVRNFFDCVKTREQPVCNADVAGQTHVACHAAALSWILKRKLTIDPQTREFVDDDEANRLRSRAVREPWRIG